MLVKLGGEQQRPPRRPACFETQLSLGVVGNPLLLCKVATIALASLVFAVLFRGIRQPLFVRATSRFSARGSANRCVPLCRIRGLGDWEQMLFRQAQRRLP